MGGVAHAWFVMSQYVRARGGGRGWLLSGRPPVSAPAPPPRRFTAAQRAAVDEGGRVVMCDFGAFILINVYVHSTTRWREPLFKVPLL